MQYIARLSFNSLVESQPDTAPILLLLFLTVFVLVPGILYLYLAGALHASHMRPFRFALYILLLMTAMTAGIEFLHSSQGCAIPVNLDPRIQHIAFSPRC